MVDRGNCDTLENVRSPNVHGLSSKKSASADADSEVDLTLLLDRSYSAINVLSLTDLTGLTPFELFRYVNTDDFTN